MSNYLSEAFKKLEILDEDVFDLDKDGLAALKDFEDKDEEDDSIAVIDPDAESEEDLEDSYIGKVILDCSVCHTDIYKDKEDITIDEEAGLANIGEECPYCYSSEGFKVIGEVKPFVETTFETDDDVEVEVENESLQRKGLKEDYGVREYSDMLYDMIENGEIDAKKIAEDLIYWVSEDDIAEYMRVNEIIDDQDYDESLKESINTSDIVSLLKKYTSGSEAGRPYQEFMFDNTYAIPIKDSIKHVGRIDSALKNDGFKLVDSSSDGEYFAYTKVTDNGDKILAGIFYNETDRGIDELVLQITVNPEDKELTMYFDESLHEDTVKQGKYWVNKGDEGTHGKFRTKKAADEQRKAMFARGYKAESLKESSKTSKKLNEGYNEDIDRIYQQLKVFMDRKGYDITDHDTLQYLAAAAEHIGWSDEEYPVAEWYRDTKMNYPEDLAELKLKESLKESIYTVDFIDNTGSFSRMRIKANSPKDALLKFKEDSKTYKNGVRKIKGEPYIDFLDDNSSYNDYDDYDESLKESYNSTLGDLVSGDSATLMSPFYLGKTGEIADAGSIVEVSNLTRRSSIPGGYHYKFYDKNGDLFYEDDLWLYNYDLDKDQDDSWINPDLIKVKLIESLKESCSINQCQKWVDYDMKKYKRISDDTMEKIKSSGYSVVKDQYGDYEVIANRKDTSKNEACGGKRNSRKMKESIEDITIDTGDQEISVSAKDKEKKSDGEMIAPLSDEMKADIEMNSDDVDVDVDEFSEEDFDELGESYLKKVYENVDSYRTTSAKTQGNKLFVEGLIKFNSGKEKKTSFVFESRTITKSGKAKLIGENLQISRGHKSFKLTGTINNGKFISESLNYNYRVKNGNSSQRVYGTAKKSK